MSVVVIVMAQICLFNQCLSSLAGMELYMRDDTFGVFFIWIPWSKTGLIGDMWRSSSNELMAVKKMHWGQRSILNIP